MGRDGTSEDGTGEDEGDDPAGEAFRRALLDPGTTGAGPGDDDGWGPVVARADAGNFGLCATPGGARALAAGAHATLATLARAGEPSGRTVGLLLRGGLLGAYLRLAPPACGAAAIRLAGQPGRRLPAMATRLLLADPPPDGPGMAALWGTLLRAHGPVAASAQGRETHRGLWDRALASAAGDLPALSDLLGDARTGPMPGDTGGLGRAVASCAEGETAGLLAARERGLYLGGPWHGREADGASPALAARLNPRTLRGMALRLAAGGPPGESPREIWPHAWASLAGREAVPGPASPGATLASRARCARWLATRPEPAWAAALALLAAWPDPPTARAYQDRAETVRLLARRAEPAGRREAGWGLARLGGEEDLGTILAAIGVPGPGEAGDYLRRARWALRGAGDKGAAPGTARAVLRAITAREGEARAFRLAAPGLGRWLGPELAPAAALLVVEGDGEAARFLVAHAPELASIRALAAAGLFPPAGTPDERARRARAARALRGAWAAALGAGE